MHQFFHPIRQNWGRSKKEANRKIQLNLQQMRRPECVPQYQLQTHQNDLHRTNMEQYFLKKPLGKQTFENDLDSLCSSGKAQAGWLHCPCHPAVTHCQLLLPSYLVTGSFSCSCHSDPCKTTLWIFTKKIVCFCWEWLCL